MKANGKRKSTVISKAIEYIAQLEKDNENLLIENASLKSRIEAFEILFMARTASENPEIGRTNFE